MKPEQVWSAALGELQMQMTQATFDTWLRGSKLLKSEDGLFVVGVTNGYAKDWLENRLLTTIKRTMARLVGRTVDVKFVVWTGDLQKTDDVSLLKAPAPDPTPTYGTPSAP